jgi:hypothetical protein
MSRTGMANVASLASTRELQATSTRCDVTSHSGYAHVGTTYLEVDDWAVLPCLDTYIGTGIVVSSYHSCDRLPVSFDGLLFV